MGPLWKVILVIVAIFAATCSAEELPDCVVVDPRDRTFYDKWTDCGTGSTKFELKEYSQLPSIEPFEPDAQFVMAAFGPGIFCIESGFARIPDLYESNITYLLDMNSDPEYETIMISIINQEFMDVVRLSVPEFGYWTWMESFLYAGIGATSYKVGNS